MVSTSEVRSAVERYRDALNRHDIDAAVAAFTDDGLIDCTPPPDGERYEGPVAISTLFQKLASEHGADEPKAIVDPGSGGRRCHDGLPADTDRTRVG